MPEMAIKESFYLLERAGEKRELTLHSDMDTAIARIRKYLKEKAASSDITLTNITVKRDKLEATQITWSMIAEKLVGGGE